MSAAEEVLESMLELKTVVEEICLERMQQITREGYSLAHDADHIEGEIAGAAASYALAAALQACGITTEELVNEPPDIWPDDWEWKPKDQRTNLIRAAALILAELQRIGRARPRS